ncbi:hypothetical protein TrST_g13147 [Triparma strigata]|uniref:CRAL-TRIO domain-containing protein n=1 Tax=Triparma strigata TaxID=1606541 RepID=A0A9W7C385_9STRA|nr:hypothetical protein TrST_g13147 [Triparma strigata]
MEHDNLHATAQPLHLCRELRAMAIDHLQTLQSTSIVNINSEVDFLSDACMSRFLTARNGNLKKSLKLLQRSWHWRSTRDIPLETMSPAFPSILMRLMNDGLTGKIHLPCYDRFGRPVVVFDNSVQNTQNEADQMKFLSYCFDLACKAMVLSPSQSSQKRLMPQISSPPSATPPTSPITKHVIFMRLDRFSILNNPPMSTTKMTLEALMNVYCERMGLVICYNCPQYFVMVYRLLSGLIDKKTKGKVVLVGQGTCKVGSANDRKLRDVLGENYRDILKLDLPYLGKGGGAKDANGEVYEVTPGYDCGTMFNDRCVKIEEEYEKVRSTKILDHVAMRLKEEGFRVETDFGEIGDVEGEYENGVVGNGNLNGTTTTTKKKKKTMRKRLSKGIKKIFTSPTKSKNKQNGEKGHGMSNGGGMNGVNNDVVRRFSGKGESERGGSLDNGEAARGGRRGRIVVWSLIFLAAIIFYNRVK